MVPTSHHAESCSGVGGFCEGVRACVRACGAELLHMTHHMTGRRRVGRLVGAPTARMNVSQVFTQRGMGALTAHPSRDRNDAPSRALFSGIKA